jgi:excisionase family DNA binding protein
MDVNRTAPYTTRELATAAGVTNRYIRQLVKEGKLAADKQGRDWFIPAAAAKAWLAQRSAGWGASTHFTGNPEA